MSEPQTNDLKEQIKAELRQELAPGRPPVIQYVNIALLVAIALFGGFWLGRRYERILVTGQRTTSPRPAQAPAQTAAQPRPTGEIPPGHPPIPGQDGEASGQMPSADMPGMAPILQMRDRLQKDPNDLEALVFLANANMDIGRLEEAVDYYRRAIALDPNNADVITDMGVALVDLGRPDEALEAFELASSVDPSHWQSKLNKAVVLMTQKNDLQGALKAFEDYLKMGPDVPRRKEVEEQIELLRRRLGGEARVHGETPPQADDNSSGATAPDA